MNEVRWGILGCGDVTESKSGPALQKIDGSRLVAVMRRAGTKAQDYAERHGVERWYDDAEALLADPEVNAIYVATPPGSHEEYAIRAMQAGKPVYVEKPMSTSFASCQRMIEVHQNTGVPLFVAYYRRCLPGFLEVKAIIDDGMLGEIRLVRTQLYRPMAEDFRSDPLPWRVLPEIAGGGLFVDLAPHQLDLFDFLLGPIAQAQGLAANQAEHYPAEDIVCAQFRFASGALGSGVWCFTTSSHAYGDTTEIIGDEGLVRFTTFGEMEVSWETSSGSGSFQEPRPEHIQQPMLQAVVDSLLGHGSFPASPESAARTNRVIDAILRDYYA